MPPDELDHFPLPQPRVRQMPPLEATPRVVGMTQVPGPRHPPPRTNWARAIARWLAMTAALAAMATIAAIVALFFLKLFAGPLTFLKALWKVPVSVIAVSIALLVEVPLAQCAWHSWRTRYR